MSGKVIDGKAIAAHIRAQCRTEIQSLEKLYQRRPGLAVILVGDDPASRIYVRTKVKACMEVGIASKVVTLPDGCSTQELIARIEEFNADPAINGILVQLPLPKHLPLERVLSTIDQTKDVDGFHLYNVGALVVGRTIFPPCTPYGVLRLLEHENIRLEGQNVVVVGASNIVGKPMALMLMQRDATVCICHAKTRDLAQFTIAADILVVAAGQPNLILSQMVKTGSVVVDVGINRLTNGRLVGDVDFEGVSKKASHITPVPGGVGPMTVTMLLVNTIESAKLCFEQTRPVDRLSQTQPAISPPP